MSGRIVAVSPMFGHASGDDFDGCSTCWDNQWAEGIANPVPCIFPSPTLIDGAPDKIVSGAIETAPCEFSNHPVGLGRYL